VNQINLMNLLRSLRTFASSAYGSWLFDFGV
jgi:hypothetical protein